MKKFEQLRIVASKIRTSIDEFLHFITLGIWRVRVHDHPIHKSILINILRVIILSFKEFQRDKCQLRASALTYYTLLSIVPIMAMAFGIAKGFGFQERLENLIFEKVAGSPHVMTVLSEQQMEQQEITFKAINYIIDFSKKALNQTSGGFIAGIGVIVLFWAVIKLLGNIEHSFNAIWGVKKDRHIGRKFTDYLSFMLLAPILLLMSSSITVAIKGGVNAIFAKVSVLAGLMPLVEFTLRFTPYLLIWILFSFIYMFMPNTKVKYSSGFVAGIVAGTMFQLVLWGYLAFQVGVAKYNSIYGSFAALPLFLILLQISWVIVLYGAEIAFAYQNVETYEFEVECENASSNFKHLMSLRIMQLIVHRFIAGDSPLTYIDFKKKLEIPARLLRQVLFDLQNANIISEVVGQQSAPSGYLPSLDVHKLSVAYVITALENSGSNQIPVAHTKDMDVISARLSEFAQAIDASPANVLLKDI